MAEKKVSVRLVAEGGRRVRAELEGVGEAGARGFGRLSREMELANTRLAAFARRAGIALGAAAAAATASLGLIVRSTAESAAQIRQFAQVANATPEALQRWSAGARTVGIEQEKLADILKDVNDRVGDFLQTGGGPMADFFENVAPRVGVTADQFARLSGPEALQLYVDTLERAGLSQQEMTFYLEAMASDATRLIPLLRNGGAEMARLGDQASDLGAVLDNDALEALRRTQLALGTVSLVFDGLRNRIALAVAPTIEALANAFVALASDGGILRSAIDTLIGNLGRLASYAATFAAVMAGRWVAGMAAAALSVRGLATALVFLRGALIRTGIGALIVGAGELVYQFSQLVARVGGVGEAFRLLGDLAREVWSGIGLSLDAALARMTAGWEGLKAAGLSALEGTIAGVVSFGDRTAAIFQGAYDAAVAIWGSLPGAIGDFAFQAANGLISGVEAMLNGVVTRINSFIETLNAALALLPEWATGEGGVRIGVLDPVELGRIGNPFEGAATAAGAAAADAFSAALARTYLEPPDLGLGAIAEDARARSDGYREAAGMLADAAGRPLASWQALKDAVTGTGTEAETALADAAASADALTTGLNDTTTLTYPHWHDVPANTWRWPNFSAAEIACRGTGAIKINTEAMDKLQALRDRLGKPLIIRSAYRSPEHNRAVGGAPASKHMQATAFDIAMSNHDPAAFEAAARAVGFLGFGCYPRSGFMHIDLGPARSWGDPFPARPVPFAPELPPAREVLSESRTLRGGGAAGAATVGAAGVEVLQDVLAETQSTIQPLVPYLDTLRWVLIVIALIGIAVAIHARLDDWKRGKR